MSIDPAVAAALPARRTFLRQLAGLPLIGGSLTLVGRPTAVAEPVTDDLKWSYKAWLHYEHRMLCCELAGYDVERAKELDRHFYLDNPGGKWHFRHRWQGRLCSWENQPQPSSRAALVLSAVGCDWRRDNG